MFARLVHSRFTHAIGRDTHVALLEPVRAILHEWGLAKVGVRTWKLAPYVEGIDGVEVRLGVQDPDGEALQELGRIARERDFDLLLSLESFTPPAAWLGTPAPRRGPPTLR